MTDLQVYFIVLGSILYALFGAIIAIVDICNGSVTTPSDWRLEGYNWFGSWLIFLVRILLAMPFYFIFTIIIVIYRFGLWLLKVGG
jgi:hypothetical protein